MKATDLISSPVARYEPVQARFSSATSEMQSPEETDGGWVSCRVAIGFHSMRTANDRALWTKVDYGLQKQKIKC